MKQQGISIIEIMVSLALGSILALGVIQTDRELAICGGYGRDDAADDRASQYAGRFAVPDLRRHKPGRHRQRRR